MAANKHTFKPGHGGGRPAGTRNKVTSNVKEKILAAFEELQLDPEKNLIAWAKDNTTEFYTKIWSKLIPTDIKADIKHTGKVILEIKRVRRTTLVKNSYA